jgi:uncharacterized protein (TIGR03067 family)
MSFSPVWRQLPIVLGLVAASFIVAATQTVAGAEPDQPSGALTGSWRLVSAEAVGETQQLEDDVRWVIKENKVLYGGEPLATLVNYPTSTPKGMDLTFVESSALYEGIYLLDRDELKICLNTRTFGTKERPFEFATKDKPDLRVLTFQRLAPADAGPEIQRGFIGMVLAVENQEVVIGDVLEKSPAEKAGLRAGDVLLTIGGDDAKDLQTTVDAVRRIAPGSNVVVRVRRDGQEKEIAVKVAVFPFSLLGLLG